MGSLAAAEQLVIWPKLFRRLVPYFATGASSLDGFAAWLRADPVNRDDELFLLDRLERGNLHDVVVAQGDQLRMTAWPEDFVISPDPAPPGAPTQPGPVAAGDVQQVRLGSGLQLGNKGDTVLLLDKAGGTVDQVTYKSEKVRAGRTICFGR